MADYFAGVSEGFSKDELGDNVPDALLARIAFVIDTLSGFNQSYGTVYSNYGDNPPSRYGQTIRRLVSYEGYTGEHAFSIGGNYSNKIFFGATLGISKLNYTSNYEHLEQTDIDLASKFKNFTYTDHFENTGTGYTFKVGAIIKPVETVRIGLAFHSPTIYRINAYHYQNITSNFTDGDHYEFYNEPLRYQHRLTTPFRALAGVAVQIKKIALLSADYEFVDYSTAKFSETGDGYDYSEKNLNIKNSLKSANNIRLGAEVRLNKLYLRSGYGYYGKAFQHGEDNQDLDYRSLSLGAGFRERNVSIDFAYTNFKYSQVYVLYPLDISFDPAIADLTTLNNMFTVTLGYKFGY
jgi:long-subunit fatty acid transport protein